MPTLSPERNAAKIREDVKKSKDPNLSSLVLVAVPLPFAQIHSFKTILQQLELYSVEKAPAAIKPSLVHINRLLRTLETLDDDLHHCKDLTFGSSTRGNQR